MSILYRSASGREVDHASSSSLDTFHLCRRKFKLSRVDGWRQKGRKASLEFGKVVESAVQFFYENKQKLGSGVEEFQRLWAKWVEQPLIYTELEKDWVRLNTNGKEMLSLFEILHSDLPIRNPKFQLSYSKELWPGDPNYGGLKFLGYIDILSTLEDGQRIVIDCKTAKSALPVTPDMISLDGQLRKYAWLTGVRDVAFLNFIKCDPFSFRKGVNVTLLEPVGKWEAGTPLVVAKFTEPKPATEGPKPTPEVEWQMYVATEDSVQKMDAALDKVSGKGSKERTEKIFAAFVRGGKLVSVSREQITKAKIQFVRGTIPAADLSEIGDGIGVDMIAMKTAHDRNLYVKDGGVRFPNATCSWCEFNSICLGDHRRRDETLVQIKVKDQEDDWLKELEGEAE